MSFCSLSHRLSDRMGRVSVCFIFIVSNYFMMNVMKGVRGDGLRLQFVHISLLIIFLASDF